MRRSGCGGRRTRHRRRRRRGRQRRHVGGDAQQRVEVDLRADDRRRSSATRCVGAVGFVARHEAEVALDDREPRVAVDGAQHRARRCSARSPSAASPRAGCRPGCSGSRRRSSRRGRTPGSRGSAARCRASCRARRSPARPAARAPSPAPRCCCCRRARGRRRAPCCPRRARRRPPAAWRRNAPRYSASSDRYGSRLRQRRPRRRRQPHRVDVVRALLERLDREPARRAARGTGRWRPSSCPTTCARRRRAARRGLRAAGHQSSPGRRGAGGVGLVLGHERQHAHADDGDQERDGRRRPGPAALRAGSARSAAICAVAEAAARLGSPGRSRAATPGRR